MDKKQLVKHLKEKGYHQVKINKHEHWKNDKGHYLTIPTGAIEGRLGKKILCDIKRGYNRIYNKEVVHA